MTMTCGEIRKKIRPFLDDLLAEEEFRAFVVHLDRCADCERYVASLGDLSNDLRQLGDVKVPAGLDATVIFELGRTRKPRSSMKKLAAWILIPIGVAAAIFIITRHHETGGLSQEATPQGGDPPGVSVKYDDAPGTPASGKPAASNKSIFTDGDKTVTAGSSSNVPPGNTAANGIDPAQAAITAVKDEIPDVAAKSLHWHLRCPTSTDREKLLDVLRSQNVKPVFQSPDLIAFPAKGGGVENILEKIILASGGAGGIRDITPGVPVSPDETCNVSIYLQCPGAAALHWDIRATMPHQKGKLLELIREEGWKTSFESERLIVLSVREDGIKKLKARILSMRMALGESGGASGEGALGVSRELSIGFIDEGPR